jgi:SAM-dependent methyltransferase
VAGIEDLADGSVDRILSAHDLHTVPDPDAVLAAFRRVLAPDGVLLVQVPLLTTRTEPLEAAPTAAPGTARWSFGIDLLERFADAGFDAELLVTDELVELAEGGPDAWTGAATSGELDLEGVLGAAAKAPLASIASRATARRRGWLPAVLFVTIRARRA